MTSKFTDILACPRCKGALKAAAPESVCDNCGASYETIAGTPILIREDSSVRDWFVPREPSSQPTDRGARRIVRQLYSRYMPSERIWTNRSVNALRSILDERMPEAEDSRCVLIGTGSEPVYQELLAPYQNVFRVGIAQGGDVDISCDICELPILDDSVDLLMSSSVIEHVYDPEKAVQETYRVLKPGGCVYAEIPFMRAYHMFPVDYQRYTISGIERLFERHGFTTIEKGICSGPFNALALFLRDFLDSALHLNNEYNRMSLLLFSSLLFHPLKFLDRFFESASWAEISACNFYYLGKKEIMDVNGDKQ